MPKPKSTSNPNWRNNRLAKIHIAKHQLAMEEDTYRALLERLFGVASAKDLTAFQHQELLAEFRRLGWKPAPPKTAKAAPVSLREPQLRKIRLLWSRLLEAGAVRSAQPEALAHFAQRLTGIERLEWLSVRQASAVIEALKAWCDRQGVVL